MAAASNTTLTHAPQVLEPLWAIDQHLLALLDSVEGCPEELLPQLEAEIAEYCGKEVRKIDGAGAVLSSLEAVQDAATKEIERLKDRKDAAGRAAERLKKYLLRVIAERDGKPLKGNNVTFSTRKSECLVITNSELVPEEWKRTQTIIQVDIPKDPIKRFMKQQGQQVPGCVIETHQHLVRK